MSREMSCRPLDGTEQPVKTDLITVEQVKGATTLGSYISTLPV